ncbi:uncharacterized protein [Lolium perenne]|uniref:uncharacterized protein n=1 Tax=Lolium perenne TaxID=4522 RepID=UPI0021F52706|nr:uncharacterized protein LOC127292828 [Lolium perenne]
MREGDQGRDEARHEPEPGCGGEAAGQAAADCAAVCCCCPMALLEVLLLVAVRLPADLLRRARQRRRRQRRLRRSGRGGDASLSGSAKAMIAAVDALEADEAAAGARRAQAEVEAASELEREIMASSLYGAGFWRSASSRSSSCASSARRP